MNTLRIFNHHVHIKFVLLGVLHLLFLVGSVFAAVNIRYITADQSVINDYPLMTLKAVGYAVIMLLCLSAMGLYRPQRENRYLALFVRVVVAFVFGAVLAVIIYYILPGLYLGRGVFALTLLLSLIGVGAAQMIFHATVDQRSAPWRVLFYGAGDNAAELLAFMRRRSDHSLFKLVGCAVIDDEPVKVDESLQCRIDVPLSDYVRRHEIDEIVVAMDDRRQNFPADALIDCRVSGINVVDMLTFYERQTGKVKTELLQPGWIIFSHGFRYSAFDNVLKRLLDLVASLVLLLVLWPFMVVAAIAIKIEDGLTAPVLFRQARVGLSGREYPIYKFRSMRTDAEAVTGPQWASQDDPRITRVGHIIRKLRIDELPQLWNVFIGDMSLVGPRPERPEFVKHLITILPYYRVRECVKPGVTGWAQLGYPYGASDDDANGKLQLDLYYVKNRSLFLDLLILVNTIEVVLFRKGSR
ncbi:TIGR03013 family XrtA/PEP-CTERM system glycosyltransferase [Salinisphaera sp.]|uniref:TIGR03013 family XrtA/PEP-CTERM system glycosyltransferase n=1 Tax=Salinisphaera sp. TaxID=1914330 RepID=UPI002D78FC80|nr:TIGR03013 family XrtA/PEP-CTERM system glycosyltransferase [Salinisphaera sp.]HET7313003.1 TIGR03013 family XrtA/PEP-CTERM system glycosyltransferase [Salinisphaera sp.]